MRLVRPILLGVVSLGILYWSVAWSYSSAKDTANDLVRIIQDENHYLLVGSRFSLFQSITGYTGPAWNFDYDPNNFGVGDNTICVNLFGEAVASNPTDFLELLKIANTAEQGAAANPYPLRSWGCAAPPQAVDHSPVARSPVQGG